MKKMDNNDFDQIKIRTMTKLLDGHVSLQNVWKDFDKLRQSGSDMEALRQIVLEAVNNAFQAEMDLYEAEQSDN